MSTIRAQYLLLGLWDSWPGPGLSHWAEEQKISKLPHQSYWIFWYRAKGMFLCDVPPRHVSCIIISWDKLACFKARCIYSVLIGKDADAGRLKAEEEGNRGWNSWMASLIYWTWTLGKFWEMVRDTEAWHAVFHGVTKSRTRLGNGTTTKIHSVLILVVTLPQYLFTVKAGQVPVLSAPHHTLQTSATDKGEIRTPGFSSLWNNQADKSQIAQRSEWKRLQLSAVIVFALPFQLVWCISHRMGSKEKRKRQAHNLIKKTQPAQSLPFSYSALDSSVIIHQFLVWSR